MFGSFRSVMDDVLFKESGGSTGSSLLMTFFVPSEEPSLFDWEYPLTDIQPTTPEELMEYLFRPPVFVLNV